MPAMIVCICNALSDRTIRAAAHDGAATVDEALAACGTALNCGCCRDAIANLIDEVEATASRALAAAAE
jgi:bacterioferritin-associated ferredoxin